jgi:hypothetical protein
VRRAVLTLESDLVPDPELLLAAASSAMQLLDLKLAEALAEHAVAAGGGLHAQIAHATTIIWQQRGADGETILVELADRTSGPARTQIAILRAMNFSVILGQPAKAEGEVEVLPTDDDAAQAIASALRASIDAARGHAHTAVERATAVLGDPPPDAVAQMLSVWTVVSGLGALGRIDEIEPVANSGYAVADSFPEVSHMRLPLAFLQAYAYQLAGALTQSDAVIARIRRDTRDVPFEGEGHAFLAGLSGMCRGDLAETQRLCQETLAYLGTGDSGRMVRGFAKPAMAAAAAMASRAADARREFGAIQWWDQDPDACEWDSEKSIAEAWVCAPKAQRRRRSRSRVARRQGNPSSIELPGKSCFSRRRHSLATAPQHQGWPSWPTRFKDPAHPPLRPTPPRSRRATVPGWSTRHANTRHSVIASPPRMPQPKPSSPTNTPGCAVRH